MVLRLMSLPPRGAWIEIPDAAGNVALTAASLPPRGAWIEIHSFYYKGCYGYVAPPTGSVD